MINELSTFSANQLVKKDIIIEEEKELYLYGIFIILSFLFYTIFTLVCGLVLNCIGSSIIFYFVFQFIRKFAGGYHASTETRCEVMSMISIFVAVAMIRLSKAYDYKAAILTITAFSVACIFLMCPIDTSEKPLTEKETKYYRKVSRAVLLIISSLIIISVFFNINYILYPACLSLVLESILLIAGKIKRTHLKRKNAKE